MTNFELDPEEMIAVERVAEIIALLEGKNLSQREFESLRDEAYKIMRAYPNV